MRRPSWAASAARHAVETTLVFSMLLVIFLVMRDRASGSDTVSVLALFAYTGFRVIPSANRIMLNVGYMREAHSWIRALDEDMKRLRVPAPRPFEPAPPMLQSALACEDVSFRYEDAPAPALEHVTFTIARGQSIGIVGPTGAGKSTLVDVLLGLLTPTSGRVLVDGQSLEGHEHAWQRQIGYVSQDVYLLDDSLRRNIAFGIPDGAIDETRLAHAVSQARLDEVVAALPQKLETVIVSHLHYDHAGNLPLFSGSRFHLQDKEMDFVTGRCMCHATMRHAYELDDVTHMVRCVFDQRVAFHDGSDEVAPGIEVHHIGGHTKGIQAVRVRTRRGWVVLASDASHFYAHMEQDRLFPIVYSVAEMHEGFNTLKRLASSPNHIVPGHDPRVMDRYPVAKPGMEDWIARLDVEPKG